MLVRNILSYSINKPKNFWKSVVILHGTIELFVRIHRLLCSFINPFTPRKTIWTSCKDLLLLLHVKADGQCDKNFAKIASKFCRTAENLMLISSVATLSFEMSPTRYGSPLEPPSRFFISCHLFDTIM